MAKQPTTAQDFEKLGAFYLGREFDPASQLIGQVPVLYDAKDLTTHAVCVGMTGSGKTGLCTCLLEEAALDGVPAIVIDMKGDMANLLLNFPNLAPEDFAPWVDPAAAERQGLSRAEFAAQTAEQWRSGISDWGQDAQRIQRLRDAVEMRIYTPGSSAATPLSILQSFQAPAPDVMADADLFHERLAGCVSGLLTLLGIEADPLRSREHILLASILEQAWRADTEVTLAELIRLIQSPPLTQVGVFDLESFYPAKERLELAMSLNNLLAAPGFASWLTGAPLDIDSLLWDETGKPRLSIIYVAHLSDAQRMFILTLLLNEIVSWVRSQSGTSSLRALLYLDEVFGYLPPVANPPSKRPLMTLLKQARAFGLGVVLATQNPADLDYKALSNAGTWFLGRLQTERDKQRVLEGLEGVAAQNGVGFDRAQLDVLLAGLKSRVFLMSNAHEDQPVLFHTRWALSYLCGPLTRTQVQALAPKPTASKYLPDSAPVQPRQTAQPATESLRPVLPSQIEQLFAELPDPEQLPKDYRYQPCLLGQAKLHFIKASANVDQWQDVTLLTSLVQLDSSQVWATSTTSRLSPGGLSDQPSAGTSFAPLPTAASDPKQYAAWGRELKQHVYEAFAQTIWKCPSLKLQSALGEQQRSFGATVAIACRERRDAELAKLHQKFQIKADRLTDQLATSESRLAKEQAEYQQQKVDTVVTVGTTLLEAMFSRKKLSSRRMSSARSATRRVGRSAREKQDIREVQRKLESLQRKQVEMQAEYAAASARISAKWNPSAMEIQRSVLAPRKSDIVVEAIKLVWVPTLIS